jgi:hypothetical protein
VALATGAIVIADAAPRIRPLLVAEVH